MMIRRAPLLALLASCGALVSCVKTVQDVSLRAPVPPPRRAAPSTAMADMMRRQVRNAVDAGEGNLRIRTLRRQLAANPADLKARLELARHYVEAGFPEIALEHYRFAAARFPDSAEVAILLARTMSSIGLPAEARAHLQAFVAGHPGPGWETLSWLAILQDRVGEYREAEANHRAAVNLRPASDALHNNLGYNLLLQGRNQEAAAEFRRALEIAPASALARSNLGIALAAQPGQAVAELQAVTDPATAHSNLAAVLIERGEYEAARREIEAALGYRKDHPAALSNLQLLSELDGGAPGLAGVAARSAWQKFWRNLGVVFFGEPSPARNAETASPAGNRDPGAARAASEN